MRTINLPKSATIAGRKIRLTWEPNANLDGWFAEVSPRTLRAIERDESISMDAVEQDLREYGDYTRYGADNNTGKTWLCVYKRA